MNNDAMCVYACVSVQPRALVEFLAQEVDWKVRFVHFSTVSPC